MRFKLFGDLDAPDWLLKEMELLARLVRPVLAFSELCHCDIFISIFWFIPLLEGAVA